MFIISEEDKLTKALLMEFINQFIMDDHKRLVRLKRYYKSDNPGIMDSRKEDEHRPDYKIAHAFASYISDTHIGYFMGSPVNYASEDDVTLEQLKIINKYNDEQSHNLRIERDASIYGIAYELQYVDSNGQIVYKDIDPRYSFPIYDDSLEQNLLYFVRMYQVGTGTSESWRVELYDRRERSLFRVIGNAITGELEPISRNLHGYQDVPVAIFANNRDRMGDFERVTPMIDAYDSIASNTLNDLENLADAYLVFKNVSIPGDTSTEKRDNLRDMRKNRVLEYNGDEDASIQWLTKEVMDGGAWEGSQAKLEEQIYYMTGTPNYNDESFAGNSSGVALKYKLQPLEQKASTKEREFKKGLQRRITLINQIIDLVGGSFSPLDIEINFKRTLPIDLLYEMQFLQAGTGLVSQETLLSQVSFVDDPDGEIEKMKDESNDKLDLNFNLHEEEKIDEKQMEKDSISK